ncbi:hypothetical protein F4823DRAFT_629564 [Ustulina deusta]|nr:hypothetical protein F4823DRAFT_629564 [Ustulina deusta]
MTVPFMPLIFSLSTTFIVTGSNTRLGYEASMQLLGLKLSHLIVAVRSLDKGEGAASAMRKQYPKAQIDVWLLDMSSYESVQAFARKAEISLARIDIVILNAGLHRFGYHKVGSTGHEEVFQVNYLSTMFLVILLLPILKAKRPPGQPAHLTIASAALTLYCKFPQRDQTPLFSTLDEPKNFEPFESYMVSKLLAQMFLWNLVDYVYPEDVVINLADPAFVRGTDVCRDLGNGAARLLLIISGLIAGQSPKVGASCYIDAVVNKGKESHGCFLMSWKIHPFPALLYIPEGKLATQRAWGETLAEFEFAGARGIIEAMKS